MEGTETGKAPPRKNLWKPEEDLVLKNYVETHGEGNWATVSKNSGLKRGGKSCRLRWKNYLRPDIKHGDMSEEERDLIIRMHKLIGNRWSLIAGRLPGRTDNEVKNYWNTHLNKKNTTGKRKDFGSNNHRDNSKKIRSFEPESSVRQGHLEMESDFWEDSKHGEQDISNLANYLISDTESFNSDTVLDYPDVSANIGDAATTFIYNDEPLVTYFDPFLFEVLEYVVG